MSKDPRIINVGVIGAGFGAQVHTPAFLSQPGCKVTALYSNSSDKAKTLSEKLGIEKSYIDWKLMLDDPDIDAVSIAMPPSMQADIALEAMSKGKAVLCEKPLAIDFSSAKKMAQAAEQSGLANMIDFEFPAISQWENAKSILENGDIGRLKHLSVSWNVETYANKMGLDVWKTRSEEGGGVLNQFTSHVFHYLEWFAGPITDLSARIIKAPGDKRTGDTLNIISVIFSSGVCGAISVSNDSYLGNGHRIEFYGELGTLILHNNTPDYVDGFRLLLGTRDSGALKPVCSDVDQEKKLDDNRITPVSRITGRFLNWIRTGKKETPDFNAGVRVQHLMEAAKEANSSNKTIKVN